jgi:hypothetical protein
MYRRKGLKCRIAHVFNNHDSIFKLVNGHIDKPIAENYFTSQTGQ